MKYELRVVSNCSLKASVFACCYEILGLAGKSENESILAACWDFHPLSSSHVDEEYHRNKKHWKQYGELSLFCALVLLSCLTSTSNEQIC